jgi:hypothetical protein
MLLEARERVGLQSALVVLQVLLCVLSLAIGRVGEPYGWSARIAGRSSRIWVQSRPNLVLPLPGAGSGIGVSSAWSLLADIT